MDSGLWLRGVVLGFSIAAPVGPIGVLCIRRTLAEGRLAGFVSGLGAATADAVYGSVAAFGLTFISGMLISQHIWLHLIGGLFLIYLGVKTLLSRPAKQAVSAQSGGLAGSYLSTLALTLTNPMTILSFAAIFAGVGLSMGSSDFTSAGLLVVGVFTGSAAWWLSLSILVGLLRKRFNAQALIWINRVSGAIIVLFGLIALFSSIQ